MTNQQPSHDLHQQRAEQITARLAYLTDVESPPLSTRIDELRRQIDGHALEAHKRDWVLTGKRVRGVSPAESHDVAEHKREHHYAQKLAVEKALREVVAERDAISREASDLRNEFDHLERVMTTPASLDEQMNVQRANLARLEAESASLAQALQQAVDRHAHIEATEQRASGAAQALEQARAQFFLAGEHDNAKRSAVDTAEAEAAAALEQAINARAARSVVAQAIENARAAIDAHGAAEGSARNHLKGLIRQRAVLIERLVIIELADRLGAASWRLLQAAPDEGLALLKVLRYEGLHVVDADGRPERPQWLQRSFDGRGTYLAAGLASAP